MTRSSDRARALIESLGLSAHPEGGYYREIFRSPAVTSIYYLLVAPERSAWHHVASDEVWHFYDGDPLELRTIDPATLVAQSIVLGRDHPAHVVPANWWQAARTTGAFSFCGCTVAPAFEFAHFQLLSDVPDEMKRLEKLISF